MELQHRVHSHVCVCTSEILANGCDVASVEVVSLLVINEEVCGQSSRLNVNHPFDLLRKKIQVSFCLSPCKGITVLIRLRGWSSIGVIVQSYPSLIHGLLFNFLGVLEVEFWKKLLF